MIRPRTVAFTSVYHLLETTVRHGGNDDLFELPLHSEQHREDSCKPRGAVAALLWLLDRLEIAHRL